MRTASRVGIVAALAMSLSTLTAPVGNASGAELSPKCQSVQRGFNTVHFRVGNSNWGWTKANEKHNLWNCEVLRDIVSTGDIVNQTYQRSRYEKGITFLDMYGSRTTETVKVVVDFSNSTESGSTGTEIVGMITGYCDTDEAYDLCDTGVNHPIT